MAVDPSELKRKEGVDLQMIVLNEKKLNQVMQQPLTMTTFGKK